MLVSNSEDIIKIPDDLAFLKSMKTDRVATMCGSDKVFKQKIERKFKRLKRQSELKNEYSKQRKEELYVKFDDLDEFNGGMKENCFVDMNDNDFFSTDVAQKKPCNKRVRTGTPAIIPFNILQSRKINSLAARMRITPAQQTALTKAFVDECGGDSSKLSLSYSSCGRARRRVVEEIANDVKTLWIPPEVGSLHWDSKIMPGLKNKNTAEDRLCVLVGDSDNVKLLGTAKYPLNHGKGQAGNVISDQTINLVASWKCAETLVNMVFDTTTSNSGHLSAACIKIQEKLYKALLWSGCRHHVGELIVGHVFTALNIETAKSP